LLHLDQWCDRVPRRAEPFRLAKTLARSLPRVCIMHGTPDDPDNRRRTLALLGDLPVVCNSRAAAQEWDGGEGRLAHHGAAQFHPIIHGYRVDEFRSGVLSERRPEIVTVCSGGDVSRVYHGIPLLERLMRDVDVVWYGHLGNRTYCADYVQYREMLATTLLYFSPTRRAPMPGARTEAMLSGCCIVTVPGQDVEQYIEDARTGFLVDTYEEARDTLRALTRDHARAWRVGQAGREVARAAFSHDRYVNDWLSLLRDIGVSAAF
jgi:glycosyltransferase involved in cell wall biosynthesis